MMSVAVIRRSDSWPFLRTPQSSLKRTQPSWIREKRGLLQNVHRIVPLFPAGWTAFISLESSAWMSTDVGALHKYDCSLSSMNKLDLNSKHTNCPPLSSCQASYLLLIRRLKINLNRQIGNLNYIHLITDPSVEETHCSSNWKLCRCNIYLHSKALTGAHHLVRLYFRSKDWLRFLDPKILATHNRPKGSPTQKKTM